MLPSFRRLRRIRSACEFVVFSVSFRARPVDTRCTEARGHGSRSPDAHETEGFLARPLVAARPLLRPIPLAGHRRRRREQAPSPSFTRTIASPTRRTATTSSASRRTTISAGRSSRRSLGPTTISSSPSRGRTAPRWKPCLRNSPPGSPPNRTGSIGSTTRSTFGRSATGPCSSCRPTRSGRSPSICGPWRSCSNRR